MKKILVTNEIIYGPNNEILGKRLLDVVESGNEFEVPSDMYWIDFPDNLDSLANYYYNEDTNTIELVPLTIYINTVEDNLNLAIKKLNKRNYTAFLEADDSVLLNKNHIVSYYNQAMEIKNNPIEGNLDWLPWEEPQWA